MKTLTPKDELNNILNSKTKCNDISNIDNTRYIEYSCNN